MWLRNVEFWPPKIYKEKNKTQNAEFWPPKIFFYKFTKENMQISFVNRGRIFRRGCKFTQKTYTTSQMKTLAPLRGFTRFTCTFSLWCLKILYLIFTCNFTYKIYK